MPIEKCITNQTEMIQKYKALNDMLAGQSTVLESVIKNALRQYQTKGDNEAELIEAFFAMIEAIEKVVMAQQILSSGKMGDGLSNFIQQLKTDFKSRDMVDSKTSTIH